MKTIARQLLGGLLVAALVAGGAAAATAKTDQTIVVTVHAPASATYNTAFTVAANAVPSGLPVSFSSSGVCSNSGNRFQMTSGTGTCTVKYDQPGDATYNAAPQVVESVTAQKADQVITFDPPANQIYGDPDFNVGAFTSSELAVTFTASGSCTLTGATVHITGAGSCTVTANQPGDANYNPAPPVSHTFTIAKVDQHITFFALDAKAFGDPDFLVSASADSKLPVSFSAAGKCTVQGRRVHLTGPGKCTITASQPGNANFNAAPTVSRTFAIGKAVCSVPRVTGKPLAAAKLALARSHCRTGRVTYAPSRRSAKGRVVSQSRRPGRRLPAGSRIDLVVGRGRP